MCCIKQFLFFTFLVALAAYLFCLHPLQAFKELPFLLRDSLCNWTIAVYDQISTTLRQAEESCMSQLKGFELNQIKAYHNKDRHGNNHLQYLKKTLHFQFS